MNNLTESQDRSEQGSQRSEILLLTLAGVLLAANWHKLHYGLSFIDEGMYLTDGWRLANGDSLFPDSSRLAASFYNLFTLPIFYLFPDISILGVRKLQWTICVLVYSFMYLTLRRSRKGYALLFIGCSLPFLFTGMDGTGMSSSLSYYSVTNILFYILIAVFIDSFESRERIESWRILSLGLLCAFIGISYLPAGVVALPVLGKLLFDKRISRLQCLAFVLPGLLYIGIVAPHASEHIKNLSFILSASGPESKPLFNGYTPAYILMAGLLAVVWVKSFTINSIRASFAAVAIATTLTSYALLTKAGGILPDFWNGWFNTPGLSALLYSLIGLYVLTLRNDASGPGDPNETKSIWKWALFLTLVYAGAFSFSSTLGSLLYLNVGSILLFLSFMVLISQRKLFEKRALFLSLTFSFSVGLPLCFFDWNFTYFDSPPKYLTTEIQSGAAKGIMTNRTNAEVLRAVEIIVDQNSEPDDFILSFDQVALPHFLTKRRPSLDHSWVGMTVASQSATRDSLDKMISLSREPELAFFWRNKLLWFPRKSGDLSYSEGGLSGFGGTTVPLISNYVEANMSQIGSIDIGGEPAVLVFKRSSLRE